MLESLHKIERTVSDFSTAGQFNTWLLNAGRSVKVTDSNSMCVTSNYVRGCSSNVWIIGKQTKNKWMFEFYSDTNTTKGVGYVLIEAVNSMSSDQVNQLTFNNFNFIGSYLTLHKKKGLQAMINHVKNIVNA